MDLLKYVPKYKRAVKDFVLRVHEEFGFPYDKALDYDLDDIDNFYIKEGGIFYLLIDDNRLIGTVAVKRKDSQTAELKRVYLLKEFRGKGLGKLLIKKALKFCLNHKFSRIVLDTNLKQISAQNLYIKSGFVIDKQVKQTIYMHKDL